MMDQYKERYQQETEQIHAPADLIARTKAAMREEEARIRRELAVQTAGSETGRKQAVSVQTAVPAGGIKYAGHFNIRKWAYPLSAAAALLILVSVSLMMRGMKSGDMAMSVEPSGDMGMGSSEMSAGEDQDAGMPAAGAAMDMPEEMSAEEGAAEETASVETDMEASSAVAEAEDTAGPMAESAASDTTAFSENGENVLKEEPETTGTERNGQQRKHSDMKESLAEDQEAAFAENGSQDGDMADAGNITIEKVTKKPDFCGRADTRAHIFEGETFQVAQEETGWAAYVETGSGEKYVIRGDAGDLETFLEAGYRKLLEQMKKEG